MGETRSKAGGSGRTRQAVQEYASSSPDTMLDVERLILKEGEYGGSISRRELLEDAAKRGDVSAKVELDALKVKYIADRLGVQLDRYTIDDLALAVSSRPSVSLPSSKPSVEPVRVRDLSKEL